MKTARDYIKEIEPKNKLLIKDLKKAQLLNEVMLLMQEYGNYLLKKIH
jgi:hypothetical protein